MLRLFCRLESQPDFDIAHHVAIPLLPDGALHRYHYDLRLLAVPASARLIGLRLDPVASHSTQRSQVTVSELGFFRRETAPP